MGRFRAATAKTSQKRRCKKSEQWATSASDLVVSTLADCYFMLTSQDLSSNYVYQILSDVANATPVSSDSSIDGLLVSGSNVYIGLSTNTDQMVIKVTIT